MILQLKIDKTKEDVTKDIESGSFFDKYFKPFMDKLSDADVLELGGFSCILCGKNTIDINVLIPNDYLNKVIIYSMCKSHSNYANLISDILDKRIKMFFN
ncbi:MAG: hypothetical protein EPN88_13745 [Bacteroidetes bacterium]|nr:MAG: hypothetical protein EPN88_13745 [Bacteroidota bacterium]